MQWQRERHWQLLVPQERRSSQACTTKEHYKSFLHEVGELLRVGRQQRQPINVVSLGVYIRVISYTQNDQHSLPMLNSRPCPKDAVLCVCLAGDKSTA